VTETQTTFAANAARQASTTPDGVKPPLLHVVCDWDVGLFNLFLGVIAHTHWALSERRIPIVYFACNNCYLTPNGYRGRSSVWEYYFEPVIPDYPVSRIPAHVLEWIEDHPFLKRTDPGTGVFVDDCSFVTNDGAWHVEVDGEGLRDTSTNRPPSRKVRQVASAIIRDYIRPRDYIIEKVEQFFGKYMAGRYVVGVHIRGTDANIDPSRFIRQTQVRYDHYIVALRRLRRANPDALILVASDEQASIDRMKEAFSGVIAYDSIRHQHGEVAGRGPRGGIMPGYIARDPDLAAQNGEEAVIEYLLLCRCNYLVHNFSSIPRAVLLTVPGMPETNVDLMSEMNIAVGEAVTPASESVLSGLNKAISSVLKRLRART
jgi:hypothetical protein